MRRHLDRTEEIYISEHQSRWTSRRTRRRYEPKLVAVAKDNAYPSGASLSATLKENGMCLGEGEKVIAIESNHRIYRYQRFNLHKAVRDEKHDRDVPGEKIGTILLTLGD